jgi:transcriptional antiterminator
MDAPSSPVPIHDDRDVLTVYQLAERWQCTTRTVRNRVRERKLRAFYVGRLQRFLIFDIRKYELESRTRLKAF